MFRQFRARTWRCEEIWGITRGCSRKFRTMERVAPSSIQMQHHDIPRSRSVLYKASPSHLKQLDSISPQRKYPTGDTDGIFRIKSGQVISRFLSLSMQYPVIAHAYTSLRHEERTCRTPCIDEAERNVFAWTGAAHKYKQR